MKTISTNFQLFSFMPIGAMRETRWKYIYIKKLNISHTITNGLKSKGLKNSPSPDPSFPNQ